MKKTVILILIIYILSGCSDKKTKDLVSQTYETEVNKDFNEDKRVKELTADIKKMEKDLEAVLNIYQKLGNYHRALGIKMIHYKMFYKAYEHFNKAIEFYPNSEMLHYYKGVAAGQYALSQDDINRRNEFLEKAKYSYEYSIELNPGFVKGLYALSILYVYEFNRPADAKPLLDKLMEVSTREFDAMLLRALLYEDDGELNEALELYNRVLEQSKNDKNIVIAETNRDKIMSRIANE